MKFLSIERDEKERPVITCQFGFWKFKKTKKFVSLDKGHLEGSMGSWVEEKTGKTISDIKSLQLTKWYRNYID